jgi:PPIC-type PPIASE domain
MQTGTRTSTQAVERPPVGWVLGQPVTYEMLDAYLERCPPPPALASSDRDYHAAGQWPGTAQWPAKAQWAGTDQWSPTAQWAARWVMIELLVEGEAARRGLARATDLPGVVATELVGDGQPPPDEVLEYFERNRDRYSQPERRGARHVLCSTEDQASVVAEQARSGEPFADLAHRFSNDPGSKEMGGELGLLRRGELAGNVEEVIFSARRGEVLGPVLSPFGWHVLVVYAIEEGRAPDVASFYDEIAAELAARRRHTAYSSWLERRMLDAIAVAPGFDHPSRPGLLDRWHRH